MGCHSAVEAMFYVVVVADGRAVIVKLIPC